MQWQWHFAGGVKRPKRSKRFSFPLLQIWQRRSPNGKRQLERKRETKHVFKCCRSSKKADAKYALTYNFSNKYNTNNSELEELSTRVISMRRLKDNTVKSWIHSAGIAQAWEESFGNLLEMKNIFQTGEGKKINKITCCPAVNCSDLTVKSKGAISVTQNFTVICNCKRPEPVPCLKAKKKEKVTVDVGINPLNPGRNVEALYRSWIWPSVF